MASPDIGRPDGIKVNRTGNLYSTGGGGVRVVSQKGVLIGRSRTPEQSRNIAFGDDDLRTLYITAGCGLYRIRQQNAGIPVGPRNHACGRLKPMAWIARTRVSLVGGTPQSDAW